MPGPKTLDEIMAAELTQDIAGRYFGFRKLIEEDEMDLARKIREYSFILEKRISFDLVRIYILLKSEAIIQEFLQCIGLSEKLFYDPYLTESPTIIRRVFECQRFKGLTRFRRFRNYIRDCYESLAFHVNQYRLKIRELEEEQGVIAEEIKEFYRRNDISAIMSFLHTLGSEDATGPMQGGMETGLVEGLEKKLRLEPPLPIEQVLPVVPSLPPLSEVWGRLKKMIKRAYALQDQEILAMFEKNATPCDRRED